MIWVKRLILRPLAALLAIIAAFLLAAWAGSSIPRNSDWEEADTGIEIMLETNGVHTALVLPLVNRHKDWRGDFPQSDLADPGWPFTHISISWGEKDVFLNTETWGDLTASTAFGAVFAGEGLLHVAHYVRPAPSENYRPITLTADEYRKLVSAIEPYVPAPESRNSYPGYSWFDVFYDAPGNYNAINSCNQWTSNMLAEAGVKTGWWTTFQGGVMKWVEAPQPAD